MPNKKLSELTKAELEAIDQAVDDLTDATNKWIVERPEEVDLVANASITITANIVAEAVKTNKITPVVIAIPHIDSLLAVVFATGYYIGKYQPEVLSKMIVTAP